MFARIVKVFDLDALLRDYRELYQAWPEYMKSVEKELDNPHRREFADYLSFGVLGGLSEHR